MVIHVLFIYLFYIAWWKTSRTRPPPSRQSSEETPGEPPKQDDQGQIAINLARGQLSQAQAVSPAFPPLQEGPSSTSGGPCNLTPNAPAVAPMLCFFYFILAQTLHLKHSAAPTAARSKNSLLSHNRTQDFTSYLITVLSRHPSEG